LPVVDGELVREVVEPEVAGGVVASAGGVHERLGEVGLPDAGLAEDHEVVGLVDPSAGREPGDELPVQVPAVEVADVLDAGRRVRCP
jgi:hypothetical protein